MGLLPRIITAGLTTRVGLQGRGCAKLTTNRFLNPLGPGHILKIYFLQNFCNLHVLVRSILRYFDSNLQKHLLDVFFIFHKNHQKRGSKNGSRQVLVSTANPTNGPFFEKSKMSNRIFVTFVEHPKVMSPRQMPHGKNHEKSGHTHGHTDGHLIKHHRMLHAPT